jgi:hypothetical protein
LKVEGSNDLVVGVAGKNIIKGQVLTIFSFIQSVVF